MVTAPEEPDRFWETPSKIDSQCGTPTGAAGSFGVSQACGLRCIPLGPVGTAVPRPERLHSAQVRPVPEAPRPVGMGKAAASKTEARAMTPRDVRSYARQHWRQMLTCVAHFTNDRCSPVLGTQQTQVPETHCLGPRSPQQPRALVRVIGSQFADGETEASRLESSPRAPGWRGADLRLSPPTPLSTMRAWVGGGHRPERPAGGSPHAGRRGQNRVSWRQKL